MVKNIIFDFGNVLFDIDMSQIELNLRQFYGSSFEAAKAKLNEDKIFTLYETGGLSTEEFVAALRFAAAPSLSAEQVVEAWNSIFHVMPAHRFDMLERLRRTHRVFLLSNINDLHERYIADWMLRERGLRDFETRYFDGVYYSHLVRLRKPDREIYEYVLADAELVPEETVFFDDLKINVEGARQVGMRAVWHEPGTEIETRVADFLAKNA